MPKRVVSKEMIAQRIRLGREQAGLSQAQVAKLLGLHRPSVSEAEAGRRNVTAEELARLSTFYGVSVAWLTCTDDEDASIEAAKASLAARELRKLRPSDLDRLLRLLATMRPSGRS
jgi:transcriptional regulator with XRE-family HTH domain